MSACRKLVGPYKRYIWELQRWTSLTSRQWTIGLVSHEHYFFRQGLFELKRLFQTTGKPDWDNFLGRLDWLVARSGSWLFHEQMLNRLCSRCYITDSKSTPQLYQNLRQSSPYISQKFCTTRSFDARRLSSNIGSFNPSSYIYWWITMTVEGPSIKPGKIIIPGSASARNCHLSRSRGMSSPGSMEKKNG